MVHHELLKTFNYSSINPSEKDTDNHPNRSPPVETEEIPAVEHPPQIIQQQPHPIKPIDEAMQNFVPMRIIGQPINSRKYIHKPTDDASTAGLIDMLLQKEFQQQYIDSQDPYKETINRLRNQSKIELIVKIEASKVNSNNITT